MMDFIFIIINFAIICLCGGVVTLTIYDILDFTEKQRPTIYKLAMYGIMLSFVIVGLIGVGIRFYEIIVTLGA